MPFLLLPGIALLAGLYGGYKTNNALTHPLDTAQSKIGLNLTTIAGYSILGGLVFYFGKKIIK